MYKVIKHFTDMQDNNFAYQVGDEYPRKGMSVLPSRIKELAGSKNRQGCPLIEEIPDVEETPKKKSKSVEKADEE
ncbi:MAG: hypothetical protein U0M06_06730 [Clostridia bacterium]|nr:hypothetical protein [Clostridia bacterium]